VTSQRDLFANFERMRREMDELFGDMLGGMGGGGRYAEFRVDTYNVTNSVRWGNPSTGYSTAVGNTFGQITQTSGSQRSVRFGGRFVF